MKCEILILPGLPCPMVCKETLENADFATVALRISRQASAGFQKENDECYFQLYNAFF